ncbi:MAG: hypothetical protein ABEL76_06590 [Bradymonadaceae bacterium]
MADHEKSLGELVADADNARVELVQVAEAGELPTLELRLQRREPSIGWVTHRRIALAAGQVPDLREALNKMDPDARDTERDYGSAGETPDLTLVETADSQRSSG